MQSENQNNMNDRNEEEKRRKYLSDLQRLRTIRAQAGEKSESLSSGQQRSRRSGERKTFENGLQDRNENNFQSQNESGFQSRNENSFQSRNENGFQSRNESGFQSRNENSVQGRNEDRLPGRSRGSRRDAYGNSIPDQTSFPKKKKKHTLLKVLLVLVLIGIAAFGIRSLLVPETTGNPKGDYTVAVFGVDSRQGNLTKDTLSDVEMLVRINQDTGEVRIVSVYRDTFLRISSTKNPKYYKINEAYQRGGYKQALAAIQDNLDITPDDYVTFNWKAVIDVINILGGVDLEITEPEFQYINSYITETVNSTGIGSVQLTHAGQNHLDGVQAVAYMRLRYMDSDYNRTERQRRVIGLVVDKLKAADNAKRISLISVILPETSTSMTLDKLIPFAKNAGSYHIGNTAGFPFEKKGRNVDIGSTVLDAVVPATLETNVVALHQFLYDDQNYTASATVKEISDYIIKKTGILANGSVKVESDKTGNAPIGPTETKAVHETAPEVQIDPTDAPTAAETTTAAAETTPAAAETSTVAETTRKMILDEVPDTQEGPGTTGKTKAATVSSTEEVGPGITKSGTKAVTGSSSESSGSTKATITAKPGANETAATSAENKTSAATSAAETAGPGAGL